MPSYPPPGLLDAIARAAGYQSHRAATYIDGHITTTTTSTGAATATRIIFGALFLPRATALDRISINVTAAGAASTVARLGLYYSDPANNYEPGALALDAGTVATDSTGVKEATIAVTLPAGLYYTAGWNSGSPTTTTTTSGSHRPVIGGTSFGAPVGHFIKDGAYSAGLPNPAGTGLSTQSSGMLVQVRLA
jgi:hypothetical protein